MNLENIEPFPKAGPRIQGNRGRKRRKSAILTETATRNELELEQSAKKKKISKLPETSAKKSTKSSKFSKVDCTSDSATPKPKNQKKNPRKLMK